MNDIIYYILSALAALIILTVHEYSHGYAAYRLGDNTAKNLGRLTLNPIKHIDPLGALCMLVFHFGWARPVPINLRNLKKPRRDFAIVALAGPVSNLILAFLSAFFFQLLSKTFTGMSFSNQFLYNLCLYSVNFIWIFHVMNIGIALFNLIPLPPLDGSRILGLILPPRIYFKILKHERTIYYVFIGWLLFGSLISRFLLSFSVISSNPVLSTVIECLTLSGIFSRLISFISKGFIAFWYTVIPALKF